MLNLSPSHIRLLQDRLSGGTPISTALSASIGDTIACSGLWRFFSDSFPSHGICWWNESSGWRQSWNSMMPPGLFSFGEDIVGNQLVLIPDHDQVFLWNHEDGSLADLLVPPAELLSTIVESGLDWIDFYSNGSLEIARKFGEVPFDSHLHWTQPLIVGGAVNLQNLSLVKCESHLVGHARLWLQIRDREPGTIIRLKS
jgi:hypothetical protein